MSHLASTITLVTRALICALLSTVCAANISHGASEDCSQGCDPDSSVLVDAPAIDDREVYIVTSRVGGKYPKVGPLRHASVAICPKGVSPVVYENGVAVSNCRECRLYGTQVFKRGFELDPKRIDVEARRVTGISASQVESNVRKHNALNIPILNDCRHHAIQALEIRNRFGRFRRPIILK